MVAHHRDPKLLNLVASRLPSDSLEALAAGRADYVELLGWPVRIDERGARLVVAAGEGLDAITMPASFGEQVLIGLRISIQAGPVLVGPERKRWAFLTQQANVRHPVVPQDLSSLDVRLVPAGSPIVLPAGIAALGTDVLGRASWIAPPSTRTRLSIWTAVIGTARRVAARIIAEMPMSA